MFIATLALSMHGVDLEQWLALHFVLASDFNPLQLVTYMFMHGSWSHILFNMFAVWMFGRIMETTWGPQRFFLFDMVCGIGAGLIQEAAQYLHFYYEGLDAYDQVRTPIGAVLPMTEYLNGWCTVGASGAVYGILLAFGMTFPDETLFIFPIPVPIKAKYFVAGYAVIEVLEALGQNDNVAHCAHLGGMLFGLLLILYWDGRLKLPSFSTQRSRHKTRMNVHQGGAKLTPDEEYNLRRQQRQAEVDRILKKVHEHGYGSLTEQEKRTLFNAGK